MGKFLDTLNELVHRIETMIICIFNIDHLILRGSIQCFLRYAITKKEAVMFTWAFQKQGWEDDSPIDFSRTFNLKDDFAKIYSIGVTNTLEGGASKCKSCPKGSTNQG